MHDHFDPLGKFMKFVLAVFGVRPHEELHAGHRVPPQRLATTSTLWNFGPPANNQLPIVPLT